jgi:hypothetical protein
LYLSVGRGIINDPLNNEALFAGAPAKRAATFYVNNGTVRWDSGDAATPWALDLIKVNGMLLLYSPCSKIGTFFQVKSKSNQLAYRRPQGARPGQRRPHHRIEGFHHWSQGLAGPC